MKKLIAIVMLALTALSVGGVILYSVHRDMARGGRAPEIIFSQEEIEVETGADEQTLLQGVTAMDKEDGDVRASLMVEHVSKLVEENVVEATYVAYDSQNHVSRASRRVRYTNYTSPTFSLSGPMLFMSKNVGDLLDSVKASDVIDGDLSLKVHASFDDTTSALSSAGVHDVELSVTNSLGDTVRLTVPVRVVEDVTHSERLPLKTYLVYLKTGDSFNPSAYLGLQLPSGSDDKENTDSVKISSNVDTAKPGVYAVDYTLERNGNVTAMNRLIVSVG